MILFAQYQSSQHLCGSELRPCLFFPLVNLIEAAYLNSEYRLLLPIQFRIIPIHPLRILQSPTTIQILLQLLLDRVIKRAQQVRKFFRARFHFLGKSELQTIQHLPHGGIRVRQTIPHEIFVLCTFAATFATCGCCCCCRVPFEIPLKVTEEFRDTIGADVEGFFETFGFLVGVVCTDYR